MMDDMELVKLAMTDNEGSVEARGELLDRCKDVLSYHIVKYKSMYYGHLNHFDVEDLVSECHIAVLESIKLYRPDKGSGFSNFAKFIIRNRIVNLLKRKAYIAKRSISIEHSSSEAEYDAERKEAGRLSAGSIVDTLRAPEPQEERVIELPGLSERNKLIVAMMLDGYSQTEVAQKLGLTKSGVNKVLKRYIKK